MEQIEQKIGIRPWVIWGLGALFFFFVYIVRVSPSIMVQPLTQAFQVNAFQLGTLSAFFYYAYVLMQVPVGLLVDRFNPRYILSGMALLCAIGTACFALSYDYHWAEVSRFLMGIGAAFACVGAMKLGALWLPYSRFGFVAGATQAVGMMGAVLGEAPMSGLVSHIGWRHSLMLMAITIALLSILMFLVIRGKPRHEQQHTQTEKIGTLSGLRIVISNPQSWINAFFVGLLYAPTTAFAELWGDDFLHASYGMSVTVAATGIGFIFLGWAIGSPILGFVTDKMGRRKPMMYLAAIMCLLTISAVIYLPDLSLFTLYFLMFFFGIFNAGVSICYAVAGDLHPKSIAGTSIGFTNMMTVLIGALLQPFVGWMLDLTSNDTLGHYTPHDFHIAMLVIPTLLLVAVVTLFFLREPLQGKAQCT